VFQPNALFSAVYERRGQTSSATPLNIDISRCANEFAGYPVLDENARNFWTFSQPDRGMGLCAIVFGIYERCFFGESLLLSAKNVLIANALAIVFRANAAFGQVLFISKYGSVRFREEIRHIGGDARFFARESLYVLRQSKARRLRPRPSRFPTQTR
jgi:hypothetical protein